MLPISDDELNSLLQEWTPPVPPVGLEARARRVFERRKLLSWRWWLSGTVRIPVPVGLAAVVLLAGFAAALLRIAVASVPQPRVVIQTRTVEVPVIRGPSNSAAVHARRRTSKPPRVIYRRGAAMAVLSLNGFEPVKELRAQILRRSGDE